MAETKWHAPSTKILSSYKDRALQKDGSGKESPNKLSHVSLYLTLQRNLNILLGIPCLFNFLICQIAISFGIASEIHTLNIQYSVDSLSIIENVYPVVYFIYLFIYLTFYFPVPFHFGSVLHLQ